MRIMPAIGRTTFRESDSIIAKTRGSKADGRVPTCCAMSPTCSFTASNSPDRFDMMPAVRIPFIQSAMALRTVSIQQSPSLAEVVDKGLEEIQEKNNVGQKLHKTPPFIDGWRFVPQCAPYDKGLLSTAEMERLRMYRRENPPAALSRTDRSAGE